MIEEEFAELLKLCIDIGIGLVLEIIIWCKLN